MRYGGKYEDWLLLVEISSVLLGGDRSIQLSYGGLYRKYSILQGSRIRTIRFLGGGPSIPVRYGGKYEDWFLLSEISSVLLGGGPSILVRYGGGCRHYCNAGGGDLSTAEKEKSGGKGLHSPV